MPYGLKVIFRRKPRGTLNVIMSFLPILSFVISTLFYCVTAAALYARLRIDFIELSPSNASGYAGNLVSMQNLFNAFCFSDAIVLWRAWVICGESRKARIALYVDAVFLFLTLILCAGAITLRALEFRCNVEDFAKFGVRTPEHSCSSIVKAMDEVQVSAMGMSFLTNLIATSTIAQKLWVFRKQTTNLERMGNSKSASGSVDQTLRILIEGGFLYCGLSIVVFISTGIPFGTNRKLGSVLFPAAIQFCGLYPMLVMVSIHRGSLGIGRSSNMAIPVSWAKALADASTDTPSTNPSSRSHTPPTSNYGRRDSPC
ncbi:hypothetical protein DL96DRAFT_1597159 [Flagelloscypha sp. PMI_526]|nr:hypothetical protein DL96DRAFT_1597159 [Flagelloscypha sp. PMI_526]